MTNQNYEEKEIPINSEKRGRDLQKLLVCVRDSKRGNQGYEKLETLVLKG